MRLTYAVVASLTLHAVVFLIPNGAYLLGNGVPLPWLEPIRTAGRLSVTLKLPSALSGSLTRNTDESREVRLPTSPGDPPVAEISDRQELQNGIGIPSLSDDQPYYYARDEIDRPPRMVDNLIENGSPLDRALRDLDDHGLAVFELWINDRGWVQKASVVSTSLPNSVVGMILNQLDLVRFIPARLNGHAVHSRIRIEVQVREKIPLLGSTNEAQILLKQPIP